MSYPDDERNPWKSLADLLSNKADVAVLATAIEKEGIRTWDRFGRMIKASKGNANDLYSKTRALDLLAYVHELTIDAQGSYEKQGELMHFLEDGESPLVRFGWPSDECPDFVKNKPEHAAPKAIAQAGLPQEDGLLGPTERSKLYAIIRALITISKLKTDPFEPYKLAECIAPGTSDEDEKGGVHPNTIAKHLKRIYDPQDTTRF